MNFDQLLESIGCPFSEHEVQGYMIGLLSQNLKNNYKELYTRAPCKYYESSNV